GPSVRSRPGNLRAELTSFVGRRRELSEVRRSLDVVEDSGEATFLCRHSATGALRIVALHGVTADIHSCAKRLIRRTRTPCPATTSGSRTATGCYGPCERTTYRRPWSGTTTPRSSTTCRARRNSCSRLRTWAVCTAVWPGPPTSS